MSSHRFSVPKPRGCWGHFRRAAQGWRRWLMYFCRRVVWRHSVLYLAVVLLDPFATGRITPFAHFNVTTDVRIFAHAGRARNPEFDSAIIGNSRGFAIEPARLSRGTKRRFVHLGLDAAFPGDQLKMLALFARHRPGGAPLILLVVDYESWCNTAQGRPAIRCRGGSTKDQISTTCGR